MRLKDAPFLPILAGLLACLLALRITNSVFNDDHGRAGDVSFKTVVTPEHSAPALLRNCSTRFDGNRTQGAVQLINLVRKPLAAYSVEWQAFDKAGHPRSTVTAHYYPAEPIAQYGGSVEHSPIDVESGVKSTMIDRVTCRLTDVHFDGGTWKAAASHYSM